LYGVNPVVAVGDTCSALGNARLVIVIIRS